MLTQKTAAGREKLLGDQDGKCGADRTTHNAVVVPVVTENIQLGVIAGPALVAAGAFCGAQVAHDVAVRIENADFRNGDVREPFLPARLPQQVLGRELGCCLVAFVPKDRRCCCFTDRHCSKDPGWALGRSGRAARIVCYCLFLSIATRKKVAMMRVAASMLPRKLPVTFDCPPLRRR